MPTTCYTQELPAQRLVAISKILRDRKPHKAGEIASILKVHPRTIRRYLYLLRDELKVPIASGRSGFYLDGPTPQPADSKAFDSTKSAWPGIALMSFDAVSR
jgi:hypothetical protein